MPRQLNGNNSGSNGVHLMGSDESDHHMVEPAPFDIYLCDYCDSELYSLEAYQVTFKTIYYNECYSSIILLE